MSIEIFQIKKKEYVRLQISGATLDDITRALPQGFYTTFTTSHGGTKVMGLRAHLQRLYIPAAGLCPVDEKTLCAHIAALVQRNLPRESRVRLILTRASGALYVAIQPFAPLPPSVYEDGVRVVTCSTTRRDPRIKDTAFIAESAAQRQLLNKYVFEVLLARNGKILEGMTSNFYAITHAKAVREVRLITARRGILRGVTRRAVLRIARGAGLDIQYRAPDVTAEYNEAFLTSSSRGIVPIVLIDGRPVGQGQVGKWTKILMKAYLGYVEKASNRLVD